MTELIKDLTKHDDALWMLIISVARHWRRAIDQELSGSGLSLALGWPLLVLSSEEREMRMSVVAAALGIEGPSLVRTMDALVREGLVSRRADPDDKRARLVKLTALGRSKVPHLLDAISAMQKSLVRDIPAEERRAMVRGLERVDRLQVGLAATGD